MNRENLKELLFKEVSKVPNREVCRVITEGQLKEIVKRIKFKEINEYMNKNNVLSLKLDEIPPNLEFQLMFYFVLDTFLNGDYYEDDEIFDLEDDRTLEAVENFKNSFNSQEPEAKLNIAATKIAVIFEYARSEN